MTNVPQIFYNEKDTYEITINPDDNNQCLKDEFRYRLVLNKFSKLFQYMANQGILLNLYPEISEVQCINDKFPRIHFHGTLRFASRYAVGLFLLKYAYMLSQRCNTQINEFRPDYWPLYCKKQEHQMKYMTETECFDYPLVYAQTKANIIESPFIKQKTQIK